MVSAALPETPIFVTGCPTSQVFEDKVPSESRIPANVAGQWAGRRRTTLCRNEFVGCSSITSGKRFATRCRCVFTPTLAADPRSGARRPLEASMRASRRFSRRSAGCEPRRAFVCVVRGLGERLDGSVAPAGARSCQDGPHLAGFDHDVSFPQMPASRDACC